VSVGKDLRIAASERERSREDRRSQKQQKDWSHSIDRRKVREDILERSRLPLFDREEAQPLPGRIYQRMHDVPLLRFRAGDEKRKSFPTSGKKQKVTSRTGAKKGGEARREGLGTFSFVRKSPLAASQKRKKDYPVGGKESPGQKEYEAASSSPEEERPRPKKRSLPLGKDGKRRVAVAAREERHQQEEKEVTKHGKRRHVINLDLAGLSGRGKRGDR